jgi:hypothetical protein
MSIKQFSATSLAIVVLCALFLAACGGSATPSNPPTSPPQATAAPTQAVEPTVEATQDVNALATSVAVVQNPPTAAPSGQVTASPEVKFTRKFRLGSLNGTLLGWQSVPGDGVTCPTITDRALALRVKLENAAAKEYWIQDGTASVLGPDDKPASTLYDGKVYMGKGGGESALQVPPSETQETIFCTGLTEKDDPGKMTLVLGDKNFTQVRVPLAQNGPADVGGYTEAKLGKTFTFKGADFSLPTLILTTGVWSDQSGSGQANVGKEWLLLPTQVNNANNPNLFVEPTDPSLEVDGQTLTPALGFLEMYQAAPYGLVKGKTGQGALLFEIPLETKQVTLHLKSSDGTYKDDVSVNFALPPTP